MATPQIPLFDSDETARELSEAVARHRDTFAVRLGTPGEGPMFRAAPDGSILDRGGRVVQPAPKGTQPKGG